MCRLSNKYFDFILHDVVFLLISTLVFHQSRMIRVEKNVDLIRDINQARTCSRLLHNQNTSWIDLDQVFIRLKLRIISLFALSIWRRVLLLRLSWIFAQRTILLYTLAYSTRRTDQIFSLETMKISNRHRLLDRLLASDSIDSVQCF